MSHCGKRNPRTCQPAPVFSGDHDDPVPLDGDGGGRAGQVGDVGDGDDQDVAGSLRSQRGGLSVRVLHPHVTAFNTVFGGNNQTGI